MLCIDEEFICIYFGQIETVCNLLGRAHSAAGHTWFRCLLLAERQAYSWHCHVSTRLCVFHRDSVAKCRLYASTCRHEWTKIRTKLFEYSKVRRFVSFPVMASQNMAKSSDLECVSSSSSRHTRLWPQTVLLLFPRDFAPAFGMGPCGTWIRACAEKLIAGGVRLSGCHIPRVPQQALRSPVPGPSERPSWLPRHPPWPWQCPKGNVKRP